MDELFLNGFSMSGVQSSTLRQRVDGSPYFGDLIPSPSHFLSRSLVLNFQFELVRGTEQEVGDVLAPDVAFQAVSRARDGQRP